MENNKSNRVFKETPSSHTDKDLKKPTHNDSVSNTLTLKVSASNSSNEYQNIEEADYEILGTTNKTDNKKGSKFDNLYNKLVPMEKTTADKLNISKDWMERMYSVILRQDQDLKKFRSKKENISTPIDIYIDLLRVSDKIPTYEALDLASLERISKSTWYRKLNEFSFLVPLIDKVEKLINKTKNALRRNLYIDCLMTLYKSHDNLEILHTNVKFDMQDRKILDKNGKEIDRIDYETDKIQYEEFMRRNGYLEIDEQIDKDLENKSEDKI